MADFQRIFVVSTEADGTATSALTARLGRSAVVLTAPTAEAKRVVQGLGRTARPDVALAPVRFPEAHRGHRLDDLVRGHAVADRARDVVVVADPATITLLLRVLAPGQLAEDGPVTLVRLPRGSAPVSLRHVAIGGVVLALATGLSSAVLPVWSLPALVALAGLALLAVPSRRRTGLTLLLTTGAAVVVAFLAVAGSARFPGSW